MYDPLPSELTSDEARFLALVAPMGLDWLTTRSAFAARHGVTRYYDWDDVIALPPSSALTESALVFQMRSDERALDLAPEHVWAHFMPSDDARANFQEMETQLQRRLGDGARVDTSNCIRREWKFGVFTVGVSAFPPQLQGAWARHNTLHAKAPRLAIAATVHIETPHACVYPDGSLVNLRDLVDRARTAPTSRARVDDVKGWRVQWPDRRCTRRNPRVLAEILPEGQVAAWRDDATARFGVSTRATSLVFERTPETRLVLARVTGDRGPDSFAVDVRCDLVVDPRHPPSGVTVYEHDRDDELEVCAKRLARLWDLRIDRDAGW